MGKHYKSTEEMYAILGALFEKVRFDPEVGKRLRASGIAVRFRYRDPDGLISVNTKDAPTDPKAFFNYELGPSEMKVDVELSNTADFAHRFWQGKENPVLAVALGKMKAKGDLDKAMALLPAIKPVYRVFPKVLLEMGRKDLVLR